MTSIRTTCPRCGEVEMEASVVLLTIHAATGEGTYTFVCPLCEDVVCKSADREVVSLLRTAGVETAVTTETDQPPAREPSATPEAPPFTLDDVIDFHFLLAREDWFSVLLASQG